MGTDFATSTAYPGVEFLVGEKIRKTKVYTHPTVLKYDSRRLLTEVGCIAVLFTQARKATVFAERKVFSPVLWSVFLCFVIWAVCFWTERNISDETVDAMNQLVGYLTALVGFPLALFVSTSVSRWWDMSYNCVGTLWDVVDDLCMWSAAWFAGPGGAEAHALIVRYGHVSIKLLWKQARDDEDLEDLVIGGLLTPQEADVLADLPSKSMVVWTWLTTFLFQAISEETHPRPEEDDPDGLMPPIVPGACLGSVGLPPQRFPTTPPVKFGRNLIPSVMTKCAQGRCAIGRCLCYLSTQQPFAYVHLLGLLCQLIYVTNSITVAIIIAKNTDLDELPDGAAAFIISNILKLVLVPLIFNALLYICVVLQDPLGDDYCDLPGRAWAHYMHKECEGFRLGNEALFKFDARIPPKDKKK